MITEETKQRFIKEKARFAKILPFLFIGKIVGVEVGVDVATHAEQMLSVYPELFLYCIDLWEQHVLRKTSYLDTEDILAKSMRDMRVCLSKYQKAIKKLAKFAARIKILKEDSAVVVNDFGDESLDFVYVDGDHSYYGCSGDLRRWWPKVKVGGILAGHDYHAGKSVEGVVKAVKEFTESNGLELFAKNTNAWCDWMIQK